MTNLGYNQELKDKVLLMRLKNYLGFKPGNFLLYKQALVHRSSVESRNESNERMEFLGDSILNAVISEAVFKKYPLREEGFLTQMRAKIVSRTSLNQFASRSGLCAWIRRYPFLNQIEGSNISGNMLEALYGAVYLDKGYDTCRRVIERNIIGNIDWVLLEFNEYDFKSRVIEICQKRHQQFRFDTLPCNEIPLRFNSKLIVEGSVLGAGEGLSKKEAEQKAAQAAIDLL